MFFSQAYAQTAGAADSGMDLFSQLQPMGMILLIFVVFWFLLLRPRQQEMKKLKQAQESLRRGDKVVTAGGIIATVSKVVGESELELEIAPTVKIRVVRSTISTVLAKTEPAKDKPEPAAKDKPEPAPKDK
jgi:preprotein translocase subunit YajC